jgi:hypothetical protein
MRRILALLALMTSPALAQQPPGQPGQPPADPADQLVGLFGATCLHFDGNPAEIRAFLTKGGAPQLAAQARDTFLAGRPGQVFDTSVPGVNLALVSLDNGACEAVVGQARPEAVKAALVASAASVHVPLTPLPDQAQHLPHGVEHAAYVLVNGGKQLHVLLATAPAGAAQAVLTLAPQ